MHGQLEIHPFIHNIYKANNQLHQKLASPRDKTKLKPKIKTDGILYTPIAFISLTKRNEKQKSNSFTFAVGVQNTGIILLLSGLSFPINMAFCVCQGTGRL